MRLADESREATGEHAVDALLGLGEKPGAQKCDHVRINAAQPPESFLAVHERHGKIEQDEVESVWLFPETLQAFKTGLDRGHFKPGFGKNAIGQDPGGRVIIDDKNPARPSGRSAARRFGSVGFS